MSRRVEVFILGDSKSAQKAFGDLSGAARKNETQLEATARKAEAAGKKISRTITGPVVLAAGAAVKAFADFDSKLTQSTAIMGDVDDAMRTKMADTAKAVSQDLNISAASAAESYFFLASAGMDAAQSVEAMPAVARFAKAGMFDMATATDLATDAQSALGLASDDAGENLKNLTRVTDVFARANELANTSVQQVAEAMTNKAGAALRVLNKDMEEGVAVLAAYADQGVKGVAAGEQLNIVLRDLQRAAMSNDDAFASASISVFDANGNMRNMADIIGDLEVHLDGMSDAQRRAALETLGFQDKSMSAMMTLLGTSDAIREYEAELRNAGGTVQRITDKQMEAFSEKMGQAKQQIIGAGIALGEDLAPMVLAGAEAVAKLVQVFTDLPDPVRNTVGAMVLLAAASGPAFVAGGKLIGTYTSLHKTLKGFTAAKTLTQVGTGVEAIGASAMGSTKGLGALSMIFSPAGALVAGLAAVAAGAWLVKKNVDRMKESHDSAAEAASGLAEAAGITYDTIEAAAAEAGDAAETTEHQFAQMNAAAIRTLRELDEAARRDYLIQLGWELVQHGATADEAFAAIQRLADAAGIDIPVNVDAASLGDLDAQLEAIRGTAGRVAREIEANWLGLGTTTKETINSIGDAAADAFKLGEVDQAIQMLAEFERAVLASDLPLQDQAAAINQLNDHFIEMTEVQGLSKDTADSLIGTLREFTSESSTAAQGSKDLMVAILDNIDAGQDFETALANATREIEAEKAAAGSLEGHLDRLSGAHLGAAGAAGEQEAAEGDLEGQTEDSTAATEEHISVLEELAETHRAALDPVFGLQRAVRDAQEAQENYTAAVEKHGDGSDEAVAAYERLIDAGLDTQGALGELQSKVEDGTVSVAGMREAVQRLVDMGLLPPELFDQAVGDLEGFILRAERGGFEIGTGIGDGVGAGVDARAQTIAERAVRMVDNALRSAKARAGIESPSKLFAEEVGEPIAEGVADGIDEGTSLIEEAIDEAVERARDRAADGVSAITSAFSASAGRARAQGGLAGAEEELAAARARRGEIAGEVRDIRRRMDAAREAGEEVTRSEEAEILRAEQRRLQAAERLDQMRTEGATALELRLAELELAGAEDELAKVRAAATAPTAELERLEEELARLRGEAAGLPARVAAAQRDLTAAQLDAVEAEKRLYEAGADLLEQGPEGETMFRNMATAAGLEESAIDRLVAKYRELAGARAAAPDAAGITRPAGAAAIQAISPKLAEALRAVGHDPGSHVDTADLAAGLARIGHDFGATVDEADIEVLLRHAAKMHTGGIVAGEHGRVPGLRPDERLRTLQLDEEVLTRSDPRHRANLRASGAGAGEGDHLLRAILAQLSAILSELRRPPPAGPLAGDRQLTDLLRRELVTTARRNGNVLGGLT